MGRHMDNLHDFLSWKPRLFEEMRPVSAREVTASDGKKLIQVCSTQYLGATWNDSLRSVFRHVLELADPVECGSFGSSYLGGTHPLRREFEAAVASETATEAALAFSSGWAANYAVCELCCCICDVIVSDIRSHNSVIHGLRSGRSSVIVADLNANDWQEELRRRDFRRAALLAPSLDGIGGESVIPEIPANLRSQILWVQDECHSFGAVGDRGTECFQEARPDIRILGFSKACGTVGAVACGSIQIIDALSQLGSPWIFSTTVPPLWWKLNFQLLPLIVQLEPERRKILELARKFRLSLSGTGIRTSGDHHISGVHFSPGSEDAIESKLREAGFYVKVSGFPTRPKNDPCARVVFSPDHTVEDVTRLALAITSVCQGSDVQSVPR